MKYFIYSLVTFVALTNSTLAFAPHAVPAPNFSDFSASGSIVTPMSELPQRQFIGTPFLPQGESIVVPFSPKRKHSLYIDTTVLALALGSLIYLLVFFAKRFKEQKRYVTLAVWVIVWTQIFVLSMTILSSGLNIVTYPWLYESINLFTGLCYFITMLIFYPIIVLLMTGGI